MSEEAKGYGEFRRGWPIVIAAMLGIGLGLSPVPLYTTGALAPIWLRPSAGASARSWLG